MTRSIAIIDFGLGNLRSLEHKLSVAGLEVGVVTEPAAVASATHLILPGVGHFGPAMERLVHTGLSDAIVQAVRADGKPVLGICLGMQLLTEGSEESGTSGLGIIPGRTVHLRSVIPDGFPLPHIGWSKVSWRECHLLAGSASDALDCFFSHSYHVECGEAQVLATASYGVGFVAAVTHETAVGVQFHPEKSHRNGIARLVDLIVAQTRAGEAP